MERVVEGVQNRPWEDSTEHNQTLYLVQLTGIIWTVDPLVSNYFSHYLLTVDITAENMGMQTVK